MTTTRVRLCLLPAAALLAASAALASGCGGNAEEDFRKERLNPLDQRAEQERAQLAAVLRTVRLGNRRDARAIREQVDALETSYREISELDPPDGTDQLFRRYTAANAGLATELRRFADELGAGDKRGLDRAGQRALEAAGQAHRAEQALREALSP